MRGMLACLRTILLASLLGPASAAANELELIFYRAPKPLDWSSPGALFRSTLANQKFELRRDGQSSSEAYPHAISHVNVALRCGDEQPIYRGMGATKSSFSYAWDMIIEGVSLDVLITNVPGRLYRERDVLTWLGFLQREDYVRSLRLKLSSEQCRRARRYLDDYERLGMGHIYGGLRSDPLVGQGAGCAAYGMSFLAVLGLIRDDYRTHWKRQLNVPTRLISTRSRSADVGAWSFMHGTNSTWASPQEPQIMLDFWDPELAYNWIDGVLKGKVPFYDQFYVEHLDGRPLGMVMDVSKHPVPRSEVFVLPHSSIAANVRRILIGFSRYLEDDEARDPIFNECRLFSFCRRPGPSELY